MTGGPNNRLADMFRLAGWSKGELARLVNRQAAAQGYPQLATDTSRVRRWIDGGETPRDPVPEVLAFLFTERLGRVVTIEDLGLRRPGDAGKRRPTMELPWAPQRTAEVLTEFTGMDLMLNRRGVVSAGAALVAGSALSDALYDWLRADPDTTSPDDSPSVSDPVGLDRYEAVPLGAEEIDALERSVEIFRAWDATRGGGLQRKAVVGQLNEVGGMLAYRHAPVLQRRLWGVAANLAVLAGWMSHDVGMEPTAQQYFLIAAHAARESGDRPRAAEALSRAARQMVHLSRPGEALDLMRLAHAGSGREALPRTRSMLLTVEAWAHAATGNRQAVHRTLGQAEELFVSDRRDEPTPTWMQMFDEADLHGMQALAHRTLAEHEPSAARPAERHAKRALELRAQGRDRSQIFDHITVASACFIADDPEQAESYARLALNAIRSNSSHRTWDRLSEMHRLTAAYADTPAVRELREEIGQALARAPGGAAASGRAV
ncbi:DNA-binding protein NsdB [Streptomyces sp. 4N509B]|uniref:DNA-binding protein NsdB n=1 Tax=Streptomyces sp. 4N509B TaxID=3457413 RepID=UPI003FD2914B